MTSAQAFIERRHISVGEHDTVPVSDVQPGAINSAEGELLLTLNETYPGFCERRYRAIRFSQYCGVVNLAGRSLEVVPKVGENTDPSEGRGVLLRLLRLSGLTEALPSLPATQQLQRQPLLEIFIALFLDEIRTIVRGGLMSQYVERERDLSVVRGRIVFSRQLGVNFNRPDIIASRFDERTADNQWNRAIKAAIHAVRPWITSADLQRRWLDMIAALDDVSDVHVVPADLDRLIVHRQAVRYRAAISWARWILQLVGPALRTGDAQAPAFLVDMNLLFERAVTRTLRRQLATTHPQFDVLAQERGRHLARTQGRRSRPVFGLRPDIVVTEGSSIVLVADTKWKKPDLTGSGRLRPSRSDMYQMHAYAAAFKARHLALIYPAVFADMHGVSTAFELVALKEQPVVHVAQVDITTDALPERPGWAVLVSD